MNNLKMEDYTSLTLEYPVITIDEYNHEQPVFILHNMVNSKGKLILTKEEAMLLFVELYKFIKS
jgi:hypothetical protein